MSWNFKREETSFQVLPEGKYRVRIRSAEKAISQSGKDMLVLQFNVSGSTTIIYHYIPFLEDRPEVTNRMLTQFFDSFHAIKEGDFDMTNWIGKTGAVKTKNEEYNGQIRPKISYFIEDEKQDELPPWQEPNEKPISSSFNDVPVDNDIPF